MTTLDFDMAALRPIIEHAKASKEFSPAYGSKPVPSLFFVKDEGIYLMSAGKPSQPDPTWKKPSTKLLVAYARGYEPDSPDSWDRCRAAVGGDDFAEALPLEWFTEALDKGASVFHLHVGADAIACSFTVPKPH